MKTQTIEDMIKIGATSDKAKNAFELFTILRPGLKVKQNGLIDTTCGNKTPLGLYRIIGSHIFN